MSTYAISDIHGCYEQFIQLFELIDFDYDEDRLIFLGDYIDRGNQSYTMVEWIKKHSEKNYIYLRGNHEEEFIQNINILNSINSSLSLIDICDRLNSEYPFFDTYKTIRRLIKDHSFNLDDLNRWKILFESMKYTYEIHIRHNKSRIIFVHAGYSKLYANYGYKSRQEFYLYARGDCVYSAEDLKGYTIIAGHTPTIIESEVFYNNGKVFTKYNRSNRCIYHNIDCGAVFRNKYPNARLACYRVDDGEIFYV